jgi:hypothetical protein
MLSVIWSRVIPMGVVGGAWEPLLEAPELLLVLPPELAAAPLLDAPELLVLLPVPPLLVLLLLVPLDDEPLSPLPPLDPDDGVPPVPSDPEPVDRW